MLVIPALGRLTWDYHGFEANLGNKSSRLVWATKPDPDSESPQKDRASETGKEGSIDRLE